MAITLRSRMGHCAKAGTNTKWHFGNSDSDLDDYGWHAGNAGASTREVGSKKTQPVGIVRYAWVRIGMVFGQLSPSVQT